MQLSIKQILIIADFAGLEVSNPDESIDFNTEFTIEDNAHFESHGQTYIGKTVHCSEHPEEGYIPLDEFDFDKRKTQ